MARLPFALTLGLAAQALAQSPSHASLTSAANDLETAGLVPLIVPQINPSALVELSFPQPNGTFLTIDPPGSPIAVPDAQIQPVISVQGLNPSNQFVAVIVDPDAPSPANPTEAQILHFLQSGMVVGSASPALAGFQQLVPGNASQVLGPFHGPSPPVGSGFHRYTHFIFTQPADFAPPANITISGFDLQTFAGAMGLGDPVAGTFFRAMNS